MAKKDIEPSIKRIFTEKLRAIAQEQTQFIDVPDPNGDVVIDGVTYSKRILSKADDLARFIWRCALGYTEEILNKDTGEMVKTVYHAPDKWAINLLFERLEGKTTIVPTEVGGRPSLADRVEAESKKTINKIADSSK